MNMLIIRADGNTTIGLGHVMRCLSIADAVKKHGNQVLFVTACEECKDLIVRRGHEVQVLDTDYTNMVSELSLLRELCEQLDQPITFLVDSYQVSEEYYQQLGQLGKVACMEDMGTPYQVDMLINYNIYGEDYESAYRTSAKEFLLGARYVPLREEFQTDMAYDIRESVQDVLITTGGSDPFFASKAFVDVFLQNEVLASKGIRYHIVSGPLNRFVDELKEHYKDCENVLIHENVKSMKALMTQCDVVLTATGSTIYEVSALGIPMMCFYFAENQRRGAEAVQRILGVGNAGDFSKEPLEVAGRAVEMLEELVLNKELRKKRYQDEKALVDGQGAYRIAKALVSI